MLPDWLARLNREVVSCTRCPRLVEYRARIASEKRRAYLDWEYWGKPVPGFGDPDARVLVLGLAPGAHGSNRTGRPFTGDASGKFMYPILFEARFSNQPNATDRNDGLELNDLYITAAVRCAPPDNKPLPQELCNCAPYLEREIDGLEQVKVVVALGRIGFEAYLNYLKRCGLLQSKSGYEFRHGASYKMPDGKILLASYHPSNQNTQTGKLTRQMFADIFREAARLAGAPASSGSANSNKKANVRSTIEVVPPPDSVRSRLRAESRSLTAKDAKIAKNAKNLQMGLRNPPKKIGIAAVQKPTNTGSGSS